MHLVIFGSFNCPYSFLASLRVDRLRATGAAQVEWRAVVHEPDVAAEGTPVNGELAEMFDREIDEIRGLLEPGESYPARRPPVQPNTTAAVAGFCVLEDDRADALRVRLFEEYWVNGADIGNPGALDRLGCPSAAPGAKMQAWQTEWSDMERAVVPTMVLPNGKLSRGMGALIRLGDMTARAADGNGGH
jgi:2-hydroxychromene-2-carboxylate isomerase